MNYYRVDHIFKSHYVTKLKSVWQMDDNEDRTI